MIVGVDVKFLLNLMETNLFIVVIVFEMIALLLKKGVNLMMGVVNPVKNRMKLL